MQEIGGSLLEKLLNADEGGYRGNHVDCGQGHQAQFIAYRRKDLVTVLSTVKVERAYYHCAPCGRGIIPISGKLDCIEPVATLYIAIDGTAVPVVPLVNNSIRETSKTY
jgi:hypothetical protein